MDFEAPFWNLSTINWLVSHHLNVKDFHLRLSSLSFCKTFKTFVSKFSCIGRYFIWLSRHCGCFPALNFPFRIAVVGDPHILSFFSVLPLRVIPKTWSFLFRPADADDVRISFVCLAPIVAEMVILFSLRRRRMNTPTSVVADHWDFHVFVIPPTRAM